MINQREKFKHPDYNHNVSNLLRNPKLDVLIAEYRDETLEAEGVVYQSSTVVILENPTEAERTLARDVGANGLLIVLQGRNVTVRRQGITQGYEIDPAGFEALWTKEILHQFVVSSQ
jgi:cyanophycin synthetase